jgi:hypothetical protein
MHSIGKAEVWKVYELEKRQLANPRFDRQSD